MSGKITYGPHLFPGDPFTYLRTEEQDENKVVADYIDLISTFSLAFDKDIPHSIINQFFNSDSTFDESFNISFLNYGNTELVYLLTFPDNSKYIALINQPQTDKEVVLKEYENLKRLFNIDPRHVIETHGFFETEKNSLYITSYLEDALCIANFPIHDKKLGIYVPTPVYHFDEFDDVTSRYVNVARIAHLVNFYDDTAGLGLANVEISGSDFMLAKDTDLADPNSILYNMKLLGARNTINVSFDEYISLVRKEFRIATERYHPSVMDGSFKINSHSRMCIDEKVIDAGIQVGLYLREHK